MPHGFNPRTARFGPGQPVSDRVINGIAVAVAVVVALVAVTGLVASWLAIHKFLL